VRRRGGRKGKREKGGGRRKEMALLLLSFLLLRVQGKGRKEKRIPMAQLELSFTAFRKSEKKTGEKKRRTG